MRRCILHCVLVRFRPGRHPPHHARARFFPAPANHFRALRRPHLHRFPGRQFHLRPVLLPRLPRQLLELRRLRCHCVLRHARIWLGNRQLDRWFHRARISSPGCSRRGPLPVPHSRKRLVQACQREVRRRYLGSRFIAGQFVPASRSCAAPVWEAPHPVFGGREHCIRLRRCAPSRPPSPPSSNGGIRPSPPLATVIAMWNKKKDACGCQSGGNSRLLLRQ